MLHLRLNPSVKVIAIIHLEVPAYNLCGPSRDFANPSLSRSSCFWFHFRSVSKNRLSADGPARTIAHGAQCLTRRVRQNLPDRPRIQKALAKLPVEEAVAPNWSRA